MATNAHPIELTSVTKSYGRARALDAVTMHLKHNEVLGLIGENGAGKSTLLKILGGVHRPDEGTLRINGQNSTLRSPNDAADMGIGVVHQEQSLIDTLSVEENISLGLASNGSVGKNEAVTHYGFYRWGTVRQQGVEALERIGSDVSPKAKVGSLSFADKQMVEIAKAVRMANRSGNAPVIILDEPTSVLEKGDIQRLEEEVHRLKALGSVIFVSHRLDEIRRICDRVYVLRGGRVVAECVASEIEDRELFHLMTGREQVAHKPARVEPSTAPPALQVKALTRRGGFKNVDLTVERGQVHAIVGTRNSGREELCRSIFGVEPMDSGEVRVAGQAFAPPSIDRSLRMGVAYLPAERKLEGMVAGLTVAENMTLTHPGPSRWGPFVLPGKVREAARAWIRKLDIRPASTEADIGQLSGGNQQKVVLAKWARDPNLKLLILDHPTRGVDPGAREHINDLIGELCGRGAGVLLLADTLDEALMLGHRVTVMRDGEVTASFENGGGESLEMAQLVEHMV